MNEQDAIDSLEKLSGRSIITADLAQDISDAFDVELEERAGELEPLSRLDRAAPDHEDGLCIGVGTLCLRIAEKRDDVEADDANALGHGTTQDMYKENNLPAIKETV